MFAMRSRRLPLMPFSADETATKGLERVSFEFTLMIGGAERCSDMFFCSRRTKADRRQSTPPNGAVQNTEKPSTRGVYWP